MPLALTTRRKQQALPAKWSTQQHLALHQTNDVAAATNTNLFRHHQHHSNYLNQPARKQKSFIENLHLNKTLLTAQAGRSYLSRGLSVGRSHDIQRTSIPREILKKHSSIVAQSYSERNDRETFTTGNLIKRNVTTGEQRGVIGSEYLRNARRVKAWSSTSSILRSLDKELAQLNNVAGKCKDVKDVKGRDRTVDNVKSTTTPKTDLVLKPAAQSCQLNRKQNKTDVNKVNLNIVLSHALDSTKEENDCGFSDQEVDGDDGADTFSSDSRVENINSCHKSKNNKKTENIANSCKTTSSLRPSIPAQQRRALYHANSLATNLALSNNNNTTASKSGLQNCQNFNASPSLTVQKRAPLVRAMSAPVRSFDERTTISTSFFNSKRKPRRRKLNSANLSCDKGPCDLLSTKDLNIDTKTIINRKVLTRSKSVTTDVVTLVSLISSEGSDSEKEDSSSTPNNSHTGSPNKRPPSLRKTGKSVSFQENYPPTFQFASKEYSHMLRRGSIAPFAQRIKPNRPPTAPAGSVYHSTQKLSSETAAPNIGSSEEKENNLENIENSVNNTSPETMSDKPLKEEYEFPEYVRSLKERECWKLFMKMSTKGVNITYDTILRGMLTPTEFRQLQRQREIEEAKALKEAADNNLVDESAKRSSTAIERLKESLLNN